MTTALHKRTDQTSALAKRDEALDRILENTCRSSGTKHAEVGDAILGQVAECFVERRSADVVPRLKGKTGHQRVVVEHVSVQLGGQAIVGAVMGAVPTGVNTLKEGSPHG